MVDGPIGGDCYWYAHDENEPEHRKECYQGHLPANELTAPTTFFLIDQNELRIGQIRMKIEAPENINFIEIYVDYFDKPYDGMIGGRVPSDTYEEQPFIWHIDDHGFQWSSCWVYVLGYPSENAVNPNGNSRWAPLLISRIPKIDLIKIAEIYNGDSYLWGGDRCPHHPFNAQRRQKLCGGTIEGNYNGTVDCSHYVFQILYRLGLFDSHADYRPSSDWDDSNLVEFIGTMDDPNIQGQVRTGDLILWRSGDGYTHTAIFMYIEGDKFWVMDSNGSTGSGPTSYNREVKHEAFRWVEGTFWSIE